MILPSKPALPVFAARPNILLVIADDYGTDSSSLYNTNARASLPPTPNINALYDSGVLFRKAYAYPTCSPTRSSILTGRYGFRTGIGFPVMEGDGLALPGNDLTIPKILTANPQLGYRHASIGKWHLGYKATDPNVFGGWSHFSGALSGRLENYFRWTKRVNGVTTTSTNYATTDTVNDSIAWIEQQGTNNWFLWLAFNAILELAGADLKTILLPDLPCDSRSLLPVLTDGPFVPRRWVLSEQFHAVLATSENRARDS